jgi:hypothetical protein
VWFSRIIVMIVVIDQDSCYGCDMNYASEKQEIRVKYWMEDLNETYDYKRIKERII